mmetsp:Transcript_13077/g.15238  ORF Transcript_13077/g.15238 Transcript_13077/m.15238 type:complete len:83 (+) Transcript_13077:1435-1683(+)
MGHHRPEKNKGCCDWKTVSTKYDHKKPTLKYVIAHTAMTPKGESPDCKLLRRYLAEATVRFSKLPPSRGVETLTSEAEAVWL